VIQYDVHDYFIFWRENSIPGKSGFCGGLVCVTTPGLVRISSSGLYCCYRKHILCPVNSQHGYLCYGEHNTKWFWQYGVCKWHIKERHLLYHNWNPL